MKKMIILLAAVAASFNYTLAQNIDLEVVPYLSGFSNPVDIANAGDGSDRLFVVNRSGVINIVEEDTIQTLDFLDIRDRVSAGGERGLLGLAFHPDYENNGFFYVNYTRNISPLATRISRFSVSSSNPNQADPDSEQILMEFEQPFSNHNGGDLNFGPNDGYLYIASGDGGAGGDPGNRSQNPQEYLGKILRIDVDNGLPYSIPASNPFVDSADTLAEIWSLGLRNPWRFSFDRQNGDMWIADVGQEEIEELNFEPANADGGYNWGWRCYEGSEDFTLNDCGSFEDYDPPVFEYTHTNNGINAYGFSVTGGYVYRGTEYPDMQGWYFMADYVTHHFWAVRKEGEETSVAEFTTVGEGQGVSGISTFGEAENGDLFIASLSNGRLFKLIDLTVVNTDELSAPEMPVIDVFPNPTNGRISIQYEQVEVKGLQLHLYNSLGAIVLEDQLTANRNFIRQYDLSAFPKGMYIVEISDERGRVSSKKFVVE